MEAQDLPVEIDFAGAPADAKSVIQRFVFEAASNLDLPPVCIKSVIVEPKLKGAQTIPDTANQTFDIRIGTAVFWSIYRNRADWTERHKLDGVDQLNIYIFYHELKHCLDERNRTVFDRQEPSADEAYDRATCAHWNEQVLVSDFCRLMIRR